MRLIFDPTRNYARKVKKGGTFALAKRWRLLFAWWMFLRVFFSSWSLWNEMESVRNLRGTFFFLTFMQSKEAQVEPVFCGAVVTSGFSDVFDFLAEMPQVVV